MSYSEFVKLVKGMKSIWTHKDFLPDEYAVQMWYTILRDIPYEQAVMAIQRYASTNRFAPTPADIREQVQKMTTKDTDWSDGWEQVLNAVRRFGYYGEKEALTSMDETTRTAVKRLNWKQICMTEQDELMALRANFRMIYEQKSEKAKEEAQLPTALRDKISEMLSERDELLLE